MKAIVQTKYGPPDFLELKEVPKPVPADYEVLVRVHASSVNDWDIGFVEGPPLSLRPIFGWFKPRVQIAGCDVAGVVEATGKDVEGFAPGDAVYGDIHACGFGAYAEYVCPKADALLPKPSALSFVEAAAVPHAATLAWQGLYDKGHLQSGQELLINGAGGGVGPIALQLAKLDGVEVTGVDSGEKLAMLRSLGCDHTIDYREKDFTRTGKRYDLILDVRTKRSPFAFVRALEPGGSYVTVGGTSFRLQQVLLFGGLISRTRNRNIRLHILKPNRGLAQMAELFEAGKMIPVVDGPYPLEQAPEALKRFSDARQIGRIVITMPANDD